MNIIDQSFNEKNEPKKNKMLPKIILAIIIILVIGIVAIIMVLSQIEKKTLKLYVDNVRNEQIKNMLVYEKETIYVPIREFAEQIGYQSYNGDYNERSEAKNKCYVENNDEIATFSLNSNKIYKKEKKSDKYQYYYAKKPVKSIDGKLYLSIDGIEKAFNITFNDERNNYKISIYTMETLIESYKKKVLDYGFVDLNNTFNNKKAIFDERLIVSKSAQGKGETGIIDLKGNIIAEPKYDEITYIPEIGDYLVSSNGKVGIMDKQGQMKIQIIYDNIELMDKDAELFLAEKEKKYGIIDTRGHTKLYMEYDEIGIDISKFEKNDIKNKYLLVNNLIPVRKDKLWGMFDKKGNQVVNFEYDGFGYIATSNKDAFNLLLIPEYNVIITKRQNKYGMINESGKEVFPTRADDIYMTIESNTKEYYLNYLDKKYDVKEYLDRQSEKITKQKETEDTKTEKKEKEETKNNEIKFEE